MPPLTSENKPWTRWWWLGSALAEAEITRHLTLFQDAGIGGVEISPIYGAKGFEDRNVAYLSDRWIELLTFTLREAKRLGMGVDMILGTGWPYGGPWVPDSDSPRRMLWEKIPANAPVPMPGEGRTRLAIGPPDKGGTRLALDIGPTGQQVKRAAPGGEGNVLDHFSAVAVRDYLAAFDRPLARLPEGEMLRCVFNDSYEVFGANATPNILAEFAKRRGYDLTPFLSFLHGDGDAETVRRVRSDYRETLGDVLHDDFLGQWTDWAHEKGSKSRNQAHGSPGNLLDLYAAADIPETEVFGPARLKLGGLKAYRSVPPDFGEEEEMLLCRMASSAAHVAGKPLCSSESFTWLGEHGCVPLEHAKAEVDTLLTLGINHIFFHGTPFSPSDVSWPGWLFYATTHMAPTNSWWSSVSTLNAYIARCQSFLQRGLPDNDLLVYFPFYDLIASDIGAVDGLQFMTVGRTKTYLRGSLTTFVEAADALEKGGWSFDFVSDRQLSANVECDDFGLKTTGGASYRAILVAGCETMPPATLERIVARARAGATVVVLGDFPADVPGFGELDARREQLRRVRSAIESAEKIATEVLTFAMGEGRILVGTDLQALMQAASIEPEPIVAHGIDCIRRAEPDGSRTYFLANPGREDWRGRTSFAHIRGPALLLDPMSGDTCIVEESATEAGGFEYDVYLAAGASLILAVPNSHATGEPSATGQRIPTSTATAIDGPWDVEFVDGGPTLPARRQIAKLADWTQWPDTDREVLAAFSGTARYTCRFDMAQVEASGYFIDLGVVCHSAKIRLNGEEIGSLIARPWRAHMPASVLRTTDNALEIEVTNLMANRLADLERREGDVWRPFLMVNIAYKPFDAAAWDPLPSGLLGPVRLASPSSSSSLGS